MGCSCIAIADVDICRSSLFCLRRDSPFCLTEVRRQAAYIQKQTNKSKLHEQNKRAHSTVLRGTVQPDYLCWAEENHTLAQEHVKTAVEAGYVDFMTSFSDLRTQEKSVELADQNYAVVKNRYENDLVLLTDMLDASNMKLSADLALENARINVVYSYYKMKYLSHTL